MGSPTPCPLDCVRAYKIVSMCKCLSPRHHEIKAKALRRLPTLLSRFGLDIEATDYAIRVAKEVGLADLEIVDLYYLKIVRINMQRTQNSQEGICQVFDEMLDFSKERKLENESRFHEVLTEILDFLKPVLDKSSGRYVDILNH